MPNRLDKVNSLLEHEISKIIARDFNFSNAVVTLTHVDTSPNLIEAKAYVSALPDAQIDHIIHTLNKGVYDIQQKINKTLNMRPIPKIKFVKDEVIAKAAKIEEILEKIKDVEK